LATRARPAGAGTGLVLHRRARGGRNCGAVTRGRARQGREIQPSPGACLRLPRPVNAGAGFLIRRGDSTFATAITGAPCATTSTLMTQEALAIPGARWEDNNPLRAGSGGLGRRVAAATPGPADRARAFITRPCPGGYGHGRRPERPAWAVRRDAPADLPLGPGPSLCATIRCWSWTSRPTGAGDEPARAAAWLGGDSAVRGKATPVIPNPPHTHA